MTSDRLDFCYMMSIMYRAAILCGIHGELFLWAQTHLYDIHIVHWMDYYSFILLVIYIEMTSLVRDVLWTLDVYVFHYYDMIWRMRCVDEITDDCVMQDGICA